MIYNVNQELKTRIKRAAASLPKQCTQSPFSERTLQAVWIAVFSINQLKKDSTG
jgi:hypothetical protein